MFTIDNFINPAVQGAKFFTSYIMIDSVRKAAEAAIDANAALTKAVVQECQKALNK